MTDDEYFILNLYLCISPLYAVPASHSLIPMYVLYFLYEHNMVHEDDDDDDGAMKQRTHCINIWIYILFVDLIINTVNSFMYYRALITPFSLLICVL